MAQTQELHNLSVPNGFIALHHKFGQKSPLKSVHFKDLGKIYQLNTSEKQSCTWKVLTADLVLPFDSHWESVLLPGAIPVSKATCWYFTHSSCMWLRYSGAGECHRISKEKGK